ncbi:fimbrial protein [Pantoea sp. Lu_F5_004]|uniref:fimbrial protein n=1 Tax=Pantoea sp. Lu_F5_004 TaxID=3443507 RepID=UPI003EBF0B39
MKYPLTMISLLLMLFIHSGGTMARNVRIVIPGGELHMRGQLTNGACVVSADSQDLHIDMGQYTTHAFERIGDLSTPGIPFTISLTDCDPEIEGGVGITFSGVTAPKEPNLFLVTASDASPTGISGGNGFSGLGLLITDQGGHPIIPGSIPNVFPRPAGKDISLHYVARYQATSRGVWPGELHSEVRFDIAYP